MSSSEGHPTSTPATVKLPHHNRYPYSAIPSRKTYEWPGGKRLAVNISNNIEIFAFRAGLGSDSATVTRAAEPAQLRLA